ncbi:hypothetical protein SAMN02799630_04500 [Paenibacillus sp. UNCCL117]|nr:hypothetical protein SAMN04488602_117109 [Paenibacillus sp. cl123]SFW57659.1 hypothetical protein SAMN02799630_04500 [Paenibacillus sp. UNCCL117]
MPVFGRVGVFFARMAANMVGSLSPRAVLAFGLKGGKAELPLAASPRGVLDSFGKQTSAASSLTGSWKNEESSWGINGRDRWENK